MTNHTTTTNAAGVVSVDLITMKVNLVDDQSPPITNMLDLEGAETKDPLRAWRVVAGPITFNGKPGFVASVVSNNEREAMRAHIRDKMRESIRQGIG